MVESQAKLELVRGMILGSRYNFHFFFFPFWPLHGTSMNTIVINMLLAIRNSLKSFQWTLHQLREEK